MGVTRHNGPYTAPVPDGSSNSGLKGTPGKRVFHHGDGETAKQGPETLLDGVNQSSQSVQVLSVELLIEEPFSM